ncbi:hypothetical protein [Mycobacterium riyadhense]|uniref:Uncharacterized protein n=2 Tax=Mycobacterium riyadhense TaxID=486698 RepID=A0A1X2D7T1_9MYCO|nr:hypothetical protein [Mycobacterium riyadhense]ORW84141.1 hypothetical protein AWC22_14250 [Mycobacterium riyadhense]VTP01815.1 hypothetical protein BIN_B_04215 [Mycobacterium riyadhense]
MASADDNIDGITVTTPNPANAGAVNLWLRAALTLILVVATTNIGAMAVAKIFARKKSSAGA